MKYSIYAKLSIALIIIVAVIRIVFALTHSVSGDACWHLSASRFMADNNEIPSFEGLGRLQAFWPPPIFHIIGALFFKISNLMSLDIANLSLKLISPIFGTLTVIIAFLLIRKVFDEKTAFYSMIFLNFIPVFLDYSILAYVGSTTAFFSILSVYLMLNKRYILSSTSLGLAILTKCTAIFMFPMILYLAYKSYPNKKESLRKLSVIVFLPLLISSVWFIRNFILLGNPFWPFLNGIFKGTSLGITFNTFSFSKIFSLDAYTKLYLEFFGVPNGDISVLSAFSFPFLNYLLIIWLIGTLIFLYPFIKGLYLKKPKNNEAGYFLKSIHILFLSYIFMLFIYITNTGWSSARLLMPVLPFIAIVWANGTSSFKLRKAYIILAVLIGTGFIMAEGIKLTTAANEWSIYKQDFEWVKDNTKNNDLFYGNGQCLSYNIDRLVINHKAQIDFNDVDYIWVNNKWRIDFHTNEDSLNRIKDNNILIKEYSNEDTGTVIYKVKK